jgi:hypothetical protein
MALTAVAYAVLFAFVGHTPVLSVAFSLMALTAVPASSRRKFHGRDLDERERAIANKALRAGFSAVWVALMLLAIGIGMIEGWLTVVSAPAWTLAEGFWWAAILMWTVQAVTTIACYRSGSHA